MTNEDFRPETITLTMDEAEEIRIHLINSSSVLDEAKEIAEDGRWHFDPKEVQEEGDRLEDLLSVKLGYRNVKSG